MCPWARQPRRRKILDKFGGTSTIDASIMVFGLLKFCVSKVGGGVSFMILCLVVEAPVGGRSAGDGLEDAVEGGFAGESR